MANFVLNSASTPNKRPPTLQEDDEASIGSVSNNNNKINSSFDVEDISMEEDDAIAAAAAATTTTANFAESLATKVNGHQVAQRLYSLAPTINQRCICKYEPYVSFYNV